MRVEVTANLTRTGRVYAIHAFWHFWTILYLKLFLKFLNDEFNRQKKTRHTLQLMQ